MLLAPNPSRRALLNPRVSSEVVCLTTCCDGIAERFVAELLIAASGLDALLSTQAGGWRAWLCVLVCCLAGWQVDA